MQSIDPDFLRPLLKERAADSHKGDYGHLLVIAGCQSMPGAAVLATGAALKSGCGRVTLHSSALALQAAACNFPSAMLSGEIGACFSNVPDDLGKYDAIAVGPGLGRAIQTVGGLKKLLKIAGENDIPMVLDADALNILAKHPALLDKLPAGSVMTPHLGELRQLTGWLESSERETVARQLAGRTGCVVVAKGFQTVICTPEGESYVNTTGNPGLAKGGTGDVLTGLIGGLLARGYPAPDAAALGVWIHGYAGDRLTERCTAEAYHSKDLLDELYSGFKLLF